MNLNDILALIVALTAVTGSLHLLTSLGLLAKIEIASVGVGAGAAAFAQSHNYIAAATIALTAIGVQLGQRYRSIPGTIALPADHPATNMAAKKIALDATQAANSGKPWNPLAGK